jgi:hypothetical protein
MNNINKIRYHIDSAEIKSIIKDLQQERVSDGGLISLNHDI